MFPRLVPAAGKGGFPARQASCVRRWLAVVFCLATALLSVPAAAQPAPESRLALLIGNSNYKASPLRNPVNDVRLMEATLKQAGFKVFRAENANRREMQRMVRDFGELLKKSGGVGLFYFSGHGLQVKGSNYLVPVDTDLQTEDEIPFDSLDAQIVLEKMESAGNRMNLLILDACRSNPFGSNSRSGVRGLAQMNAPSGTLVAYATSPGNVALDGAGNNSPYTQHLARAILQPGVPVEEVFKMVRTAVRRDTGNAQTPWENTALEGQFFFRPALQAPASAGPVAVPAAAPSQGERLAIDLAFWNSVKDSTRPDELQAYLAQFPEGQFAALARARLAGPLAAAVPLPPAAAREGGMLHVRDDLSGVVNSQPLRLSADADGNATWSSGDVIAADGRVLAVRLGKGVGRVADGRLWRFPLAAGQEGEAALEFPEAKHRGSLKWKVSAGSDGGHIVEGAIQVPFFSSVQDSVKTGTWRAEYAPGDNVPAESRLDVRLRNVGGSTPDRITVRREAAAAAALGRMVLADPRYGTPRMLDVTLGAGLADRRTYSTGDVIANDGRVIAVRMGDVVLTVSEGALWSMPLRPGTRGRAAVTTAGQAVAGSVEWEVTDPSTVAAKINYYVAGGGTMASHSVDQNRRYGTWTGTFSGGMPFATSFRMQTFNGGYARSNGEVLTGELQRGMPPQ
jgi:uncharacterized caspase-like protein